MFKVSKKLLNITATLGEWAFMFAAPKLWNNLLRDIRESNSINILNRSSRRFFLRKHFINDKVFIVIYSLIKF